MPTTDLKTQIHALANRIGGITHAIEVKADANTASITSLGTALRDEILQAKNEAIATVTGEGTKEALDTLKEIADYAEANKSLIDGLTALAAGHVHFDKPQELTSTQQAQARTNIGAAADADVVKHTASQGLNTTQQGNARTNIGAASAADLDALEEALGDLTDIDFVATFNTAYAGTSNNG